jgi:hypothetical protein
VLLVPKGQNDWRMVIDYRKLNAVTKKEIYAIPRIDDVLDGLGGAVYFTTLDLASGYFQIPMELRSKEKTAFVTYNGTYHYNFMSFGLVNAPSTFQRTMDSVLAGLKWACCQVYLDDIIIASPTFEQHLIDVTAVLSRLKEAGFKLKASKCHFCCPEVNYLGHLISKEGIRANPDKIEIISNWGIPEDGANLHSFLGLAGYYRKLIPYFAQREAPLRKLLLKDSEFKLGTTEIIAFNDLKKALMSDPIVSLPDFSGNSTFVIFTDASDLGISAILSQIDQNKVEKVIHYASRMLTKQELKWHTQEKEALAIVWGCNKFRAYIIGNPIIIRTDHHSLQWLMRSEKGKLARWALSMSEFDYTIEHRAGKQHANADVPSRWTKTPADENWDPFPYYSDPLSFTKEVNFMRCADCKENCKSYQKSHPIMEKSHPKNEKSHPKNFRSNILMIKDNSAFTEAINDIYIDIIEDNNEYTSTVDLLDLVKSNQAKDSGFTEAKKLITESKYKEAELIIKKYLKSPSTKYSILIKEDILCRGIKTSDNNFVGIQILIPLKAVKLQTKIIELNHDPVMYSHLDAKRTTAKVWQIYFWPGVTRQSKIFISSCIKCQVHKSVAPSVFNRPLRPTLPEGPNCLINCDLIGPLPLTETKFCYAAVMVDNFTKWAVVAPLKNKEADEVADAIYNNWYCKLGIPYEMQTDQGLEFCNDLLKRINSRMGVGHKVTTPYYPQANGQVERYNRTLKTCLSIYSEDHPSTWDKYINGVTWAYNSSINPVSGFSP